MRIADVKNAVANGLNVCWSNERYQVVVSNQWLVGFDIGGRQENYAALQAHAEEGFYVPASALSYAVDDCCAERTLQDAEQAQLAGTPVRLVAFGAGAERVWVAVWSYLDVALDDLHAEELATDLLLEKNWFADPDDTESHMII